MKENKMTKINDKMKDKMKLAELRLRKKMNKIEVILEARDENDPILSKYINMGFVNTPEEVDTLIDTYAEQFLLLVEQNSDLMCDFGMEIEHLTPCPVIQNWEGSHAILVKYPNGNVEIL